MSIEEFRSEEGHKTHAATFLKINPIRCQVRALAVVNHWCEPDAGPAQNAYLACEICGAKWPVDIARASCGKWSSNF